jgi:hypothetical protein
VDMGERQERSCIHGSTAFAKRVDHQAVCRPDAWRCHLRHEVSTGNVKAAVPNSLLVVATAVNASWVSNSMLLGSPPRGTDDDTA